MASWSTRRKYAFFFGFALFFALAAGIPAFLFFYEAPTCFDGKQNGGERGVDCGGACAKLCPADYASPRVLWSYSVKVVPGIYHSLAYIDNPNPTVEAKSLSYVFRLYDDRGLLVSERRGRAFVPAGQKLAVFEGAIETGTRIPVKTTFEFLGAPDWKPGAALPRIRVVSADVEESATPRAEVAIKNETIDVTHKNVTAFMILYDEDDNRVSFSKTVIESLGPGESKSLFFTWPEAFPKKIVRKEVLFVGESR